MSLFLDQSKSQRLRMSIIDDRILIGSLPRLHETLQFPLAETIVKMHFIRENGEWFATEYDPDERRFFGYIDVRPGSPHWGFFDLDQVSDCYIPTLCPDAKIDANWDYKKAKDVTNILGGE